MKNNILLMLSLVTSFNVFSMGVDPNKIIENTIGTVNQDELTRNCNEESNKLQELSKACAISICGPANKIKTGIISGAEFNSIDFSAGEKQFQNDKNLLLSAHKNNIEYRRNTLKELLKRLEDTDKFELNDVQMSNFILNMIQSKIDFEYNADSKTYDISLIDLDKKTTGLVGGFKLLKEWLPRNLENNIPLKLRLGLSIELEEYKNFMIENFALIDNAVLNKGFYNPDFNSYFNGLKQNYSNSISQPDLLPEHYMGQMSEVLNTKESLFQMLQIESKSRINFCEGKGCKKLILGSLKDSGIDHFKGQLKGLDELAKHSEKTIDSCKSLYYLDDYNRQILKEHGLHNLTKKFATALDDTVAVLSKKYSRDTAQRLYAKVSYGLNLVIAGTSVIGNQGGLPATEFLNNAKKFMNKAAIPPVTQMPNYPLLMTAIKPYDFLSSVSMSCSGAKDSLVIANDAYNDFSRILNISAHSCVHDLDGKQSMAHEIAHAFSALVKNHSASDKSKKQFFKDRSCLNDRTKLKNYDSILFKNHNGDHLYSEEDMADFIENKVYENEKTAACNLLPIINGEFLTFDYDNIIKDSHSPVLFRLINSLTDRKKKIPSECEDFLKKVDHLYAPKNC